MAIFRGEEAAHGRAADSMRCPTISPSAPVFAARTYNHGP